jgi:hypothetical protein
MNPPLEPVVHMLRRRVPAPIRELFQSAIFECNHDYRKAVFLAGTGRGGTTWVSAILNYDNRYRDMFEPFHSHYVRSSGRFVYTLYLRPEDNNTYFLTHARRILEGRIRHWWIDQANRRRIVTHRLVKEVRANLWLKWLHSHFPGLPIILLLRHPCAVADSRLLLEWPTRLQMFLSQPELVQDHLLPLHDRLLALETPFERHIAVWCIQHAVPLRQFTAGDIHLAFYESFVVEPEAEIRRLFAFLRQPYSDRILETLERPSWTTRQGSAVRSSRGRALLESWRKRINASQQKRAVEILGWFGLSGVYGFDPLPDRAAAERLLGGPGETLQVTAGSTHRAQ